jgi:hypothetical protein
MKQTAEAIQPQFNEALGEDLPITLDVSSFPEDKDVLDLYEWNYEDNGLPMILRVVKDICKDDIGKQAFKEKVQSIEVVNTSKSNDDSGSRSVDLQPDGKLVIRYAFNQHEANIWNEEPLRTTIENML